MVMTSSDKFGMAVESESKGPAHDQNNSPPADEEPLSQDEVAGAFATRMMLELLWLKESIAATLKRFAQSPLVLRGHKVILDSEIAELFGVPTWRVEHEIFDHADRFPEDFAFRLTSEEVENLNQHRVAAGLQKNGDPGPPRYALTEHGTIMVVARLRTVCPETLNPDSVRNLVGWRDRFVSEPELVEEIPKMKVTAYAIDRAFGAVFSGICESVSVARAVDLETPSMSP